MVSPVHINPFNTEFMLGTVLELGLGLGVNSEHSLIMLTKFQGPGQGAII